MRPSCSRSSTRLLPVGLLILLIAIHGFRIQAYNEDPQGGSAFAMFSTVDIGATRRVLATVPGDTPIVLDIPDTVETARARLVDIPTDDSARRVATELLQLAWEVDENTATVGNGVKFEQVRVRVVGLDVEGSIVSRQVLTDVVVGHSSS